MRSTPGLFRGGLQLVPADVQRHEEAAPLRLAGAHRKEVTEACFYNMSSHTELSLTPRGEVPLGRCSPPPGMNTLFSLEEQWDEQRVFTPKG
jgi:hypothetical protein